MRPDAPAPAPVPLAVSRAWQDEGTLAFLRAVQRASSGLREPSRLSGWSRAEVVAHVARNADALVNLLTWAHTGTASPMYESPAARERDIAETAALSDEDLVADFVAASERYASAVTALPDGAWLAGVRTANGRWVTAANVPWMRTREVWMHAVDLGEVSFGELPTDLAVALLEDACRTVGARSDADPVRLEELGDAGRVWTITGAGPDVTVRGALVDLCAYVLRGAPSSALDAAGSVIAAPSVRWL